MTTPNTFTIEGQTFTVGDKMLHGDTEVEIVGPVGNKTQKPWSVVFKYPNGNMDSCGPRLLKPIPEETIPVPVKVLKTVAWGRSTHGMTIGKAMQTVTDLLREAGH